MDFIVTYANAAFHVPSTLVSKSASLDGKENYCVQLYFVPNFANLSEDNAIKQQFEQQKNVKELQEQAHVVLKQALAFAEFMDDASLQKLADS